MKDTHAVRSKKFREALAPIARAARQRTAAVYKMAATVTGQTAAAAAEFFNCSTGAAYLAFCAEGGDFDTYESFDFGAHWDEMVRRASAILEYDYQGPGSSAWDFRARTRDRQARAEIPSYQWTAWAQAGAVGHYQDTAALGHIGPDGVRHAPLRPADLFPQEVELIDSTVTHDFVDALRDTLLPHEFYLFTEHYLRGRSHKDLALEELGVDSIAKADKAELNKAEARINSCLRRGRVRARRKLARRWRAMAQDCAA